MTHAYAWGRDARPWQNGKRATLYGRRCRLLAVARRMGSVLVEFENGQRECVSRRALRRLSPHRAEGV